MSAVASIQLDPGLSAALIDCAKNIGGSLDDWVAWAGWVAWENKRRMTP